MAQYQITVDGEILHQLFRGDEGVAKLLECVLNQVLEAQVGEHIKAEPYERTHERVGYRNGYREREMKTRVGTLELRVPPLSCVCPGFATVRSLRSCLTGTSVASRRSSWHSWRW